MRKSISLLFFIIVLFALSACEPTVDRLKMRLNPNVDTIKVGSVYEDSGAHATYGLRTLDVEILSDNLDTTTPGVYEIVYKASYGELEKTMTRKVTVTNELDIEAELNIGLDTIYVGDTWVDAGVFSESDISVEVLGEVDTSKVGEYMITYDINDGALILVRYVNVIE